MTITETNEILALEMPADNDADVATIGEFFEKLLVTLWDEGEGFSGKRPFGNSGWQSELFHALVMGGKIKGKIDEDGYLQDYDPEKGNKMITDLLSNIQLTASNP